MSDTTLVTTFVVHPATGEGLALDSPTADLGRFLDEVRDLESRLREAKRLVGDEVHRRMDRERRWTLRDGDYELRGESDEPKVEWDKDALYGLLLGLVEERTITPEAAGAALEEVRELKLKQRGLSALRKNPELRERIDSCGEEVPLDQRQRRVSVRRAK